MKAESSIKRRNPRSTGHGKEQRPDLWPFPPSLLSYPTRPITTDRSRTRTQQYEDMKTDIGDAAL